MKDKEDFNELVESLDKIHPVEPSFHEKITAYLEKEMQNLQEKQGNIKKEIDQKNKDVAVLRETLLVVNGALQGIQHVHAYVNQAEGGPSLNSTGYAAAASPSPGSCL